MVNKYYQKYRERLQKEACERHQNISEDKTDKSSKNARERYRNLRKKKRKRHQYY